MANAAFCRLGAFKSASLHELSPEALTARLPFAEKEGRQLLDFWDACLKGKASPEARHLILEPWEIVCQPLGMEGGREALLCTFYQSERLWERVRELEENLALLHRSNASLEQFAYVASHDLQEPLRKVKAFGDMLQLRYSEGLGTEGSDLIRRMQSAAARMSVFIDDLLTYSRVAANPVGLTVVDANQVLDGVLLDLEAVIQKQQALIFHDRLMPVAAQATQLGQVFLNLIGNALKFHPADVPPEIQIHSHMQLGRETGLRIRQEDAEQTFQVIRISDKGIGFPQEESGRIFEEFHRLNNRSAFPGSGLGLSIVKKVVEHHRGYIEASSSPGAGATFTLLFPAVSP